MLILCTFLLKLVTAQTFPNGYVWGCLNISATLPFCNTSLSIDDRVTDLIGRLTQVEKTGLLGPDLNGTGVDGCNCLDAGVLRLGIPNYMNLVEVNSAVSSACLSEHKCATEFPSPALLAGSFNRSLWRLKGEIISTELRALNNLNWYRGMQQPYSKVGLTGFGPNINMVRDPRFGRNSELPSEDPFLSGAYAAVYTRAMQYGPDPKYLKMISGLKHYAAYSVENGRESRMFNISTFDLFDTYLPQYQMGFTADGGNAQAVMCSYAGVNGVPSCASDFLLNQVVRQQWSRPDVLIVTDCGAIDHMVNANHYAKDGPDAAAKAINGGVNIDVGDGYFTPPSSDGNDALNTAVQNGQTDEAHVDSALRRVLTKRFMTGQFDPLDGQQYVLYNATDVNTTSSHNLVLDAALQGLVLLKNDKMTLPFKEGQKIAVVGPHVISQRDLFEDYKGDQECYSGDDSCVRTIGEVFTTLHGSSLTNVQMGVSLDGTDASGIPAALNAVQNADQVILCIGIGYEQEHEGIDRTNTLLPGIQESFAEQVLAIGKPTVIVLINGGIVSIDDLVSKSPAIIEAFYPAMRGAEALYYAIFGYANRWGKLPVTIYESNYINQVDMYNFNVTQYPGRTYRYFTGSPLFEFGFGLSYTTFAINCTLLDTTINCIVKNSGTLSGDDVLLVYHRVSKEIINSVDHPVPIKALVDFERVSLNTGASTNLNFTITNRYITLTNNAGQKIIYPGEHYFDITDGIGYPVTIPFIVSA